jgi:hypothetical protein
MDLKVTGPAEVTIGGDMKSMEDYQEIKNVIRGMIEKGNRGITLKMPDSITMTSSVIGYLLKLVRGDGIEVKVEVKEELYDTLKSLKLIEAFKVTLMQ